MPFFSVIVPVYNKAQYLENSLNYLYDQTFEDFEIIAIDDGSSDESLEILKAHENAGRLKLYCRTEPGPGGYAARNYGARKASADWLLFFDADDKVTSVHLESFKQRIDKHQNISFFANGYEIIASNSVKDMSIKAYDGIVTRLEGLKIFSNYDYIHMNGVCIDKNTFLSLGGFPEGRFKRGGDVYFWMKVLISQEQTYYNNIVSSSWLYDNGGIAKNIKNLSHVHPLLVLLEESKGRISFQQKNLVRKAVNRKIIGWCKEKKENNGYSNRDLKGVCFSALSLRQIINMLLLSFPGSIYTSVVNFYRLKLREYT